MENREVTLVIDNVRSLENIGSMFRTADAVGVKEILCVGISGYPDMGDDDVRRPYLRLKQHKALAKTALSGITVPFRYFSTASECLQYLREHTLFIIAAELNPRAQGTDLLHDIKKSCALVMGNELSGVSQEFLDAADVIVQLPMHGRGTSLNVSVAAGVILYLLLLHK